MLHSGALENLAKSLLLNKNIFQNELGCVVKQIVSHKDYLPCETLVKKL